MEAVSEATGGQKLDELEKYFARYRDLPREIILKHDLPHVGHWFTDAALELASQALVKSYRLFSYDLMPMKEMKRKEHRKTPEWFTVRRGMYGLRPVRIQTTLDANSPYVIDLVNGQPRLFLNGEEICEVHFPKPLKYDTRTFADGTAYHKIIAFGYFVTVFRNCPPRAPTRETLSIPNFSKSSIAAVISTGSTVS